MQSCTRPMRDTAFLHFRRDITFRATTFLKNSSDLAFAQGRTFSLGELV